MAFFLVLWFFLLLAFGSVDSWAVCTTTAFFNRTFSCEYANAISSCKTGNSFSISTGCSNKCSSVSFRGDGGSAYCKAKDGRGLNCDYFGDGGSQGTFSFNLIRCTTQCEADSAAGCPPGKVWSSSYCACVDPPPMPKDTTWHCQNAGGPEPGGFGGPRVAKLFKCYDGSCHNTRDLSGSCQDWGFCEDGVDDCEIADSLGTPRVAARVPALLRLQSAFTRALTVRICHVLRYQRAMSRVTSTRVSVLLFPGRLPSFVFLLRRFFLGLVLSFFRCVLVTF